MMRLLPALVLLLTACPSTPPEAPETPAAPSTAEPAAAPTLSADELGEDAAKDALVPSPMEMQRALQSAGIDTKLASLVPDHSFNMTATAVEHAAVRTGVILADLLLTLQNAPKDRVLSQIQALRTGMKQLDGGSDIDALLAEAQEGIETDATSRERILAELDRMSGAVIPELEFNGVGRVVPLIQAGSWLEGANLVARAAKAKNKPEAADTLLKQPEVVAYFLGYVRGKDAPTTPGVASTLESSLLELKELANLEAPLNEDNIDAIIATTGKVLSLL